MFIELKPSKFRIWKRKPLSSSLKYPHLFSFGEDNALCAWPTQFSPYFPNDRGADSGADSAGLRFSQRGCPDASGADPECSTLGSTAAGHRCKACPDD